jgi:hypothetical protein
LVRSNGRKIDEKEIDSLWKQIHELTQEIEILEKQELVKLRAQEEFDKKAQVLRCRGTDTDLQEDY